MLINAAAKRIFVYKCRLITHIVLHYPFSTSKHCRTHRRTFTYQKMILIFVSTLLSERLDIVREFNMCLFTPIYVCMRKYSTSFLLRQVL